MSLLNTLNFIHIILYYYSIKSMINSVNLVAIINISLVIPYFCFNLKNYLLNVILIFTDLIEA